MAKTYISAIIAAGGLLLAIAVARWDSRDPVRLLVFLALFVISAALKYRVPGIMGTYSPAFFFVLLGCVELPFSALICLSGLSGIVQCTWKPKLRPSAVQIVFNAASLIISAAAAFIVVQWVSMALASQPFVPVLIFATIVFYAVNTAIVSIVLALVEAKPISQIWGHWRAGSLAYYVFGASLATIVSSATGRATAWCLLLTAPLVLYVTLRYRARAAEPVSKAS